MVDKSEYAGGAEKSLLDMAGGLSKKYDITILSQRPRPHQVMFAKPGITTSVRCMSPPLWERSGIKKRLKGWGRVETFAFSRKFRRVLSQLRPDIVHFNLYRRQLKADIREACRANIPVVLHVRNQYEEAVYEPDVLALADLVVCVSEAVRRRVLAVYDSRRVVCVYNGPIDEKAAEDYPGKEIPSDPDTVVRVLAPAVLEPRKGQQDAILALAALTHSDRAAIKLRIVGGDNPSAPGFRTYLHRLVRQNGLQENVEILGHSMNMDALYAASDVVIVASRSGEAFGRVAAEAGRWSLPVIATDAGALPEIIISERTGLIVPCKDVSALADAMARLGRNGALRHSMGLAGKARVVDKFGTQRLVREIDEHYRRLLDPHDFAIERQGT